MAKYGFDDVYILIDGYNVQGFISTVNLTGPEATLEETHGVGDSWVEQDFTGLKRWDLNIAGWFDDESDSVEAALSSSNLDGSTRVVCVGYEGNTVGKECIGLQGPVQGSWNRRAVRGELTKFDARLAGSGNYDEGIILHELSAETADGDTETTDQQDNGGSSANGAAAYLQVTAIDLDGYDDITVTVRDSSDDITYGDLVAFTAVTAAPTAERVTVAGTVEQYTAVEWAYGGTGTSPSTTFLVGLTRL